MGRVEELHSGGLSLRVVTPQATQRASFEKHRGADARAVMGAKLLNFGDR